MSSMLTEPTKTWRCFQSVVSRILIRQQQPRTSQTWYWLHMWWCSWLCCCSCCWLSSSALCSSWHPSKTLFLCLCFSFFASVLVPLPLFRFLCFCFGSFAMRKSFVLQSDFPMVEAGLQRNGVTERKKQMLQTNRGPNSVQCMCMWFDEIEGLSWNEFVFYPHW